MRCRGHFVFIFGCLGDPWGGSAGDVPKRAQVSSTPKFISTPTSHSRILSSPIYTSSFTGSSKASALTESGKVPPSTDEPGRGETQKSILAMSEQEIIALEERARKIGGTGEWPFVHRSPFAPSSLSLSPHTSSSFQPSSYVSQVPHVTGSRYFGVDYEHVEDIGDDKKTHLSIQVVEEFVDGRKTHLSTNVFHLCRESHEVPECDDDKILNCK